MTRQFIIYEARRIESVCKLKSNGLISKRVDEKVVP